MLRMHHCTSFATNRTHLLDGQGPMLVRAQASGAVPARYVSMHVFVRSCTALLKRLWLAAAARCLFASHGQDGQAKAKLQPSLHGSHDSFGRKLFLVGFLFSEAGQRKLSWDGCGCSRVCGLSGSLFWLFCVCGHNPGGLRHVVCIGSG